MAIDSTVVLIADPEILAIPVSDNHEALVDVRNEGGISIGPSPEVENNLDYTYMRKTVYEKLITAQSHLPKGLFFCLYEAYRSLSLQERLFQNRLNAVKRLHSNWTQQQQFNETTRLVSPVINFDGTKNIPPHSTGGAFDLYLIDDHGKAVDMGIHPKDWMNDKDGSLSQTDSKIISAQAQHNRQLMNAALESVGFVNYPAEYWHWSYGDRYWSYVKQQTKTLYSSTSLPAN